MNFIKNFISKNKIVAVLGAVAILLSAWGYSTGWLDTIITALTTTTQPS